MPFIVMCYEYCNKRHWFECDFLEQFKKEWENKNFEEYEVKYLIVAGQWLNGCKDFESIMKIMNG